MKNFGKTLKAAFPHTLPVLTGFIFLGTAYGILMINTGFGTLFTICTSIFIFAGSLQFASVPMLISAFNPLNAFLLGLMVNARHIFYGISMIDRYKVLGKSKTLAILTLCDETFSVICNAKPPEDVNEKDFILTISVLNYSYWVLGTVIGATIGSLITFDVTGIDFSLTALFIVIFVNQWKETKNHIPALIGLACTMLCLILLGDSKFMIPSMILIIIALVLYKKPYERTESHD